MNNFIELHLWDAVEDKGNTPVLVNISTISQVMTDCAAPTIIYFGTDDYIRVAETYDEVKRLMRELMELSNMIGCQYRR